MILQYWLSVYHVDRSKIKIVSTYPEMSPGNESLRKVTIGRNSAGKGKLVFKLSLYIGTGSANRTIEISN